MTGDNTTRWTVTVSKDTDIAVRSLLAQRGLKKGDLSKFIEDAVKWRVFDQTYDNYLLSIASGGEADYLVTGDKPDLLALGHYQGTKIVSVRDFITLARLPS